MTALLLITPPAAEPVSLAEAKAHLRVEHSADDSVITGLITAARQMCEEMTSRALITQGWRLWLDASALAPIINLPRPPLISVAEVASVARDDSETVLSAGLYHVDNAAQPGRLILREGQCWPSPGRIHNFLRVDYQAGYGTSSAYVPMALRQGMLTHIAQLYARRGDDGTGRCLPPSLAALYQNYRPLRVWS